MLRRCVRIHQGCMMVSRPETPMAIVLDQVCFPIFLHQFPKAPFCLEILFQFRVAGMEWVIQFRSIFFSFQRELTNAVAFNAEPFQSNENPLRFRSIPDSLAEYHVEASECCLIHYDNPLSETIGVWINPAVRVGYSPAAHIAVSSGEWPTKHELRWGNWKSKWTWWIRDPGPLLKVSLRRWQWRRRYPDFKEPGLACVEDLAMVVTGDGWRYRGAYFE